MTRLALSRSSLLLALSLAACDGGGGSGSTDEDGDGLTGAEDCAEGNAAVGAPLTLYTDGDGDGFGDDQSATTACTAAAGQVVVGGDCDDQNDTVAPGRSEHCDGLDQDCDGVVDNGMITLLVYTDSDGDGFGAPGTVTEACELLPGASQNDEDCDDADSAAFPGAEELCDGIDQDCDGVADNGAPGLETYYVDADHDGFGAEDSAVESCLPPPDSTTNGLDCDDGDVLVNPDAEERCDNGQDDDCDGGAGACAFTGTTSISDAEARLRGDADYAAIGDAVTSLGDVDGDGKAEVAVSATHAELSKGRIWVLSGAALAGEGAVSDLATATWTGTVDYGDAGTVMDAPGDLTGDGRPDLVVGSDRSDVVWVLPGDATGEATLDEAATRITWPGSSQGWLGYSVHGAGDTDGDGAADLLVSAPLSNAGGSSSGAAYLFRGPLPEGELSTADADATLIGPYYTYAGYGVGGGYDLDGDGFTDVAVTSYMASSGHGSVWVQQGPLTGSVDLEEADATLTGTTYLDHNAWSVTLVEDVGGDGYADALIAAPADGDGGVSAGAVYLLEGPLTDGSIPTLARTKFVGENLSYLGYSTKDVGDIDGDGQTDISLSAPYRGSYAGSVYTFYSPLPAGVVQVTTADARVDGSTQTNFAGIAYDAGDVNGDGTVDLLLTATQWSGDGLSYAGALFAVYGSGL